MSSGDVYLMDYDVQQEHKRHIEKLDMYKKNLADQLNSLIRELSVRDEESDVFDLGILKGLDMAIKLIDTNRIY